MPAVIVQKVSEQRTPDGRQGTGRPAGADSEGNRLLGAVALLAAAAIVLHLVLRFVWNVNGEVHGMRLNELPLVLALVCGGTPLVVGLLVKLLRGEFSSDLLAGISIVTSVALGELLA